MSNAPPASVRAALAATSKAIASLSPDVGFGSRQALPYEDPGKAGQWAGDCQLTGINVKWDDTFRLQRGENGRDSDTTTPAASVSLSFVTKLEGGQATSWSTRPYRWIYGDLEQVIPETPNNWLRRNAQTDMAVIMGWFQALLGTSPTDPIIRQLDACVEAVEGMLAEANSKGEAVMVKAGYVKKDDSYDEKDRVTKKKTGKKVIKFDIKHYVYKNYFGRAGDENPA